VPANPEPISTPFTAGIDIIALARSASSLSNTGSPQPAGTPRAHEIIDKGTTALFEDQDRAPAISENTRRKLLQDYVEERAWREPPKPPQEEGSWRDVAEANREELFALGLWGVPSFRVNSNEPHWGQDRLWVIEQELQRIGS
jgi:hypothetical protein